MLSPPCSVPGSKAPGLRYASAPQWVAVSSAAFGGPPSAWQGLPLCGFLLWNPGTADSADLSEGHWEDLKTKLWPRAHTITAVATASSPFSLWDFILGEMVLRPRRECWGWQGLRTRDGADFLKWPRAESGTEQTRTNSSSFLIHL